MNFKLFSARIRELVHDPEGEVDDEMLNNLYWAYKEQQYLTNLDEWVEYFFEDYEAKSHKYYLKTKMV